MNNYLIGNAARVSIRFRNAPNGVAVDPTTITLIVENPSTTLTTYVFGSSQIIRDSVGNYHFDINLNAVGIWKYRWTGTGTNQAAAEGSLVCTPSIL